MTYKETFLRRKELREQLAAVTHADWFKEAMVFIRAEMMSSKVSTEELEGARKFEEVLMTIADFDTDNPAGPSTGLDHHLDDLKRKRLEPKTETT